MPGRTEPRLAPRPRRRISIAQAMAEAMTQEMARDASVVLLGQELEACIGLGEAEDSDFALALPALLSHTPMSAATFVRAAAGTACAGLRPIVELRYIELFGMCMDQIYHHIAKRAWLSAPGRPLPVVLVLDMGDADRELPAPCLHASFAHMPGLKVVVPSNAHDAKGLLAMAIRDDDPVVFIQHGSGAMASWQLAHEREHGVVPLEPYVIPLGRAHVLRQGQDLSIVAVGPMVGKAVAAARELSNLGFGAEVIDLRTLVPLDAETVLASVAHTGRLLVADDDFLGFGLSGEIAAPVAENLHMLALKSPVRRLARAQRRTTEGFAAPSVHGLVEAARELMLSHVAAAPASFL